DVLALAWLPVPSVRVTVMVSTPGGVPPEGALGYWCGALKPNTVGASCSWVFAEPSPQLIVTVWPSRLPGWLKVPLRVTESPSLTVAALRLRSPSLSVGGSSPTRKAAKPVTKKPRLLSRSQYT